MAKSATLTLQWGDGSVDNNHSRLQQAQLAGAGALAAQKNAPEALAMFTPAVLIAHLNASAAHESRA